MSHSRVMRSREWPGKVNLLRQTHVTLRQELAQCCSFRKATMVVRTLTDDWTGSPLSRDSSVETQGKLLSS